MKIGRWQLLVSMLMVGIGAQAQWLNYPEPGVPRLKNGKVNLHAPAPRVNGKPVIDGILKSDR